MELRNGKLGYLVLLLSAIFLDIPMIGLLASFTFLLGGGLLIVFHLDLVKEQKSSLWLKRLVILAGLLLLSGLLGFTSVKYHEHLISLIRETESPFFASTRSGILLLAGLNIVAALLIFSGIKGSPRLTRNSLFTIWVPSVILLPLTIMAIKILYLILPF